MTLFMAPLDPRGWRGVWYRATQWYRRKRGLSKRWKSMGYYTPED